MTPDYVAGHSLGEYSALVAAGSLRFADAVRLVRKRGQYMQEAVPPGVGAMAAMLKLPEGKLDAVLAEAAQGEVVSAANLNSPDQVVIAGHAGAVNRAMELAKAAGARRAVLLPVSAPFHCALMAPAQERLRADLDATEFRDLARPLVNNWQAREIRTGAEAREGLYQQVPNPVRWAESIRYLASQGVTQCIEVGAGGVLTGMLRSIDPNLAGAKFGEPGISTSCDARAPRTPAAGGRGVRAGIGVRPLPCGDRGELREDRHGPVVLPDASRSAAGQTLLSPAVGQLLPDCRARRPILPAALAARTRRQRVNVEEKQIDFVMGSGNHAKTYLHLTPRGTLQQLPLGWYAENGGTWAMNPGYDRPDYPGSTRAISYECMFCHNAYPKTPVANREHAAEPKYSRHCPRASTASAATAPGQAAYRDLGQGRGRQSAETPARPRTRGLSSSAISKPAASSCRTRSSSTGEGRFLTCPGRRSAISRWRSTARRGGNTAVEVAGGGVPAAPVGVLPQERRQAALHHLSQSARHPARSDGVGAVQQGLPDLSCAAARPRRQLRRVSHAEDAHG